MHNYDGSFDYHPVPIRNQSLEEYYKKFAKSARYAIGQNEKKVNKNGEEKIPTIKYRFLSTFFFSFCHIAYIADFANIF